MVPDLGDLALSEPVQVDARELGLSAGRFEGAPASGEGARSGPAGGHEVAFRGASVSLGNQDGRVVQSAFKHARIAEVEDQINALKGRKASMDAAAYEQELEKLVTDLALKTRAIQQLEKKK